MIYEDIIQNIAVADSPNNDAFETIVELYFQLKGYITSSGKWFWYAEKGKHQRGYQDFDVLAINKDETIIVSCTSNLDDKVAFNRQGQINNAKLKKVLGFFERSDRYISSVPEYKWLSNKPRKTMRLVAYLRSQKKRLPDIKKCLSGHDIQLLSATDIVDSIVGYLNKNKHLKVQNQILRMIQVLEYNGVFDDR